MNENNKNLVDGNQAPTSDNVVAKGLVSSESNFLQLIEEVTKIYNEIVEQTAERNKKICEDILNRVQVAEASVRNLKDRKEFFTEENYIKLYRLVNIIRKMRQFLVEITQLKGLKKYIHSKAIQEIFNNLVNEFEATIRILQVSISLESSTSAEELTLSTVCAGREAASKVEIPFADFLQLIDEVTKLYNKIVEIYQKAEHNKRICEAMLNRVKIADTALKNLRIRNLDFFSKKNYDNFRNLVIIIKEIRQFLIEITKSSGFEKLTGTSSINENFSNLIDKFESAIKPLQFSLIIYFNADDYKKVKTDVKDLTAEEWIKKNMKEEDIKYFEYSEFNKIKKIGEGGFGVVNRAETNDKVQVALKGLIEKKSSKIEENVIENFVKELKNLRKVAHHVNIISFLGISKDDIGYVMVLEYANEGNLRDYFNRKFDSLQWENKIRMALDITCGLKCLHSDGIIHRDLHSKNILVNNGRLLIADFGLSKRLTEVTSNSKSNNIGIIEYVEPQCLRSVNYVKDKRSDVYSLGVLLWEITSGHPPFHTAERDMLGYHISHENLREEPIDGTPSEYRQLYQKCWDGDPEKRPNINEVYNEILRQYANDANEQQEDPLAASISDNLNSLYKQSGQLGLCIETCSIDCNRQ
ncbi:kinase-like protein [Rhizophagus irregularis]|uniref:Kinase-like protein n=1 Tax=Rhizophagus irregularis TaxID=588596 RepID=A0A2N0SKM9_9GLOM|nr:kinase-like protein [Rhizophagus irregularis]